VGEGIFTSTDKQDWNAEDVVFGECSHVVFSGTKFYVAENGFGIRSFDGTTWQTVHEDATVFTSSLNVNGIPLFGTADGRIMYGPLWDVVTVGEGVVNMAFSNKFHVTVNTPNTLETFSGRMGQLVSEGVTNIEGFTVTDMWYDAVKEIVVVSAYATDDQSPVFFNCKNGVWTFVFSDLNAPALSLANGAVATADAIYTTTNYSDFVLLHSFEGFEVRDLIYA
jgi:hypothetical protein